MSKLKIIVVDDCPTQLKLLQKLLSNRIDIKEALIASNGKEAIDIIKNEDQLDLVITDYNMPIMNGLELIRALKADEQVKHIPIIILSAEVTQSHMLDAIEAGAAMELLKPFTLEEFNKSIDYVIKEKQDQNGSSVEELKAKISSLVSELADLRLQLKEAEKLEGVVSQ